MIASYSRPTTLDEAYRLLQSKEPRAVALAGGTTLMQKRFDNERIALVDLQSLGMSGISLENGVARVGSMTRLNDLMHTDWIHPAITRSLYVETNNNLRNTATIGGTLLVSGKPCPVKTLMLAMDIKFIWHPGGEASTLSDTMYKSEDYIGKILVAVEWQANLGIGFEYISRSPSDKVDLCLAVSKWQNGRTRVAVSGTSPQPILALDGTLGNGCEKAIKNAYSQYLNFHINPHYITKMINVLLPRAIHTSESGAM